MSFSVQVPGVRRGGGPLEWSGTSLSTVFAQRATWLNPRFWGMLRDLLRFNRLCHPHGRAPHATAALMQPLGDFLEAHRFGGLPRLVPPAHAGLHLELPHRPDAALSGGHHDPLLPQPRPDPGHQPAAVVDGGRRLAPLCGQDRGGIADKRLNTPVRRIERDARACACTPMAMPSVLTTWCWPPIQRPGLALLAQPSPPSAPCWAPSATSPTAPCCTPTRGAATRRSAWAAWNYERAADPGQRVGRVCLHYLINRLQPLPWQQPVVVSLNPVRRLRPNKCWANTTTPTRCSTWPPSARRRAAAVAGRQHTWFCGAWTGYGFHEDGLKAGQGVGRPFSAGPRPAAPGGGRMNRPLPALPHLIGFGQVRHRRLRPRTQRLHLPTFFLLLPMRSPGAADCAGMQPAGGHQLL
jgi:hypothetical protein